MKQQTSHKWVCWLDELTKIWNLVSPASVTPCANTDDQLNTIDHTLCAVIQLQGSFIYNYSCISVSVWHACTCCGRSSRPQKRRIPSRQFWPQFVAAAHVCACLSFGNRVDHTIIGVMAHRAAICIAQSAGSPCQTCKYLLCPVLAMTQLELLQRIWKSVFEADRPTIVSNLACDNPWAWFAVTIQLHSVKHGDWLTEKWGSNGAGRSNLQ